MAKVRTFLAVDLPEDVRQRIMETSRQLAAAGDPVKWVEPQNLHVTLKFLGDVEDRELYDVCRVAQQGAEQVASFRAECRGIGAFPDLDRPRTIWAGVEDPEGKFTQLHARLEEGYEKLRFPRELRPYRPHITLGRQRAGRRRATGGATLPLREALVQWADTSFGPLTVEAVTIYGSELTSEGPVYTRLGTAPLA